MNSNTIFFCSSVNCVMALAVAAAVAEGTVVVVVFKLGEGLVLVPEGATEIT